MIFRRYSIGTLIVPPKKSLSIEKSLAELGRIAESIESEDTGLKEAIKAFENAVVLSEKVKKELEGYEQTIELLTSNGSPGQPKKTSSNLD